MIKNTMVCDICKQEMQKGGVANFKAMAIFLTEQNEGRGCKPYFEEVTVDICQDCHEEFNKSVKGKYVSVLIAHGCQGHNEYNIEHL